MSVLLRDAIRPKQGLMRRPATASIREVCLLGGMPTSVAPGDRVTRSGRAYRVEAAQAPRAGDAGTPGYLHLSCPVEG
jgi:hypothetical protein